MQLARLILFATALIPGLQPPLGAQFPDGAMRTIAVAGQPTRVVTLGLDNRVQGAPVLFLHAGGGVRLEGWASWLLALSKLAPVVAYDRIGIGGSPFDNREPTFDRVLTHAHELLATLHVAPPYVLVGHSIGGVIIFKFATQYMDEVTGLVCLDPTPIRLSASEWVQADNDSAMKARWHDLTEETAGIKSPGHAAWVRMVDAWLQSPVADRHLPADPDIATAVVLGARSASDDEESWWNTDFIRVAKARGVKRWGEVLDRLSHGTLLVAYDAGHFVFLDAPGLSLEAVRVVLAAQGK